MSIAFDSFWWWRAEFDGRANPYRSPTATATQSGSTGPAAVQRRSLDRQLDPTMPHGNDFYDALTVSVDYANWHWPAALTFEDDHMSMPPLYYNSEIVTGRNVPSP